MFGESVGLMCDNASQSAMMFHHALDYAQQGTILRLRLGNLMFAHRDRKFRDCCKTVHAYASRFVEQALEYRRTQAVLPAEKLVEEASMSSPGRQKYVFLNELAKDTDDPVLLRDQIVNMLLAARDTTAGLLSFAFFVLARRPDVWAKLRADVLEHYRDPLTYESIAEMTYLRYVLQESKPPPPIHRKISPCLSSMRTANNGSPECSAPVLPAHSYEQPDGAPGHGGAVWRGPRRMFAALCEEGQCGDLQYVRDASTKGVLRGGRGGVSPGEVGAPAAWVGISSLQRWPTRLPGPEVRAD